MDLQKTFSTCAQSSLLLDGYVLPAALHVLSYLVSNYARPSPRDLKDLSRKARQVSDECFETCCLGGVTSAANPFIPGIFLSVGLAAAAEIADDGEKTSIISLQNTVDNLLLEILDRLPQTVRGFNGGMDGCCAVLEPELLGIPTATRGLLSLALKRRQQTERFCTAPLVIDFLSRRFTRGLPNLRDTDGTLKDPCELKNLIGGAGKTNNSLILNRFPKFYQTDEVCHPIGGGALGRGRKSIFIGLLSPRALLQGAHHIPSSLTWLPGAQFITAGLVGQSCNYYKVPAMRMALDFVVYLGMLKAFTSVLTLYEPGTRSSSEYFFAAYVLAGYYREGREWWRDKGIYIVDRWNIIDVLGLLLYASGFIFRLVNRSSRWGHILYIVCAPLFFVRILFFAQILRFQGPMIEVIFSMTAEVVRFGIVMVVVIIGFAVSFQAFFRRDASFSEVLLDLFKVMLGDVGYFDRFARRRGAAPPTILLVTYLVIMTIILLNLLVAIMSTSHSKVQRNADREYNVSKARIIQHYRLVVDKHLLPAPFNLVQLFLSLPFKLPDLIYGGEAYYRVQRAIGQLVFWLVLSPFAVAGGALLWITSVITVHFAWHKYYSDQMTELVSQANGFRKWSMRLREEDGRWSKAKFMTWTHLTLGVWCLVGAPLCLFALWLWQPLTVCKNAVVRVCGRWPCEASNRSQNQANAPAGWSRRGATTTTDRSQTLTIEAMLTQPVGGVAADDLCRYLEDPMMDAVVREYEKKRGVTIEHMKLLRNRLERTLGGAPTSTNQCLQRQLDSVLNGFTRMSERFERLEKYIEEHQHERVEINDRLASVLSAVSALRRESIPVASGTNPDADGTL